MNKYNNILSNKKKFDTRGFYNKNNNVKRILCYNILTGKKCPHLDKCMYSHSLSEQKIDYYRNIAYGIIKNKNTDLSSLDLLEDTKLYENLLQLTKVCSNCIKSTCPGGYNCKYGCIKKEYQICYNDLVYGKCRNLICSSIHLTDRNLVSYNEQKKIENGFNIFIKKDVKLNEKDIDAILLTSEYFRQSKDELEDSDVTDETSSDIQRTIEYLNSDTNNSEDESIFID